MILPKYMHINGLFLTVTKFKVSASRRKYITKEKLGKIEGDSNMVHLLTAGAIVIPSFSEK